LTTFIDHRRQASRPGALCSLSHSVLPAGEPERVCLVPSDPSLAEQILQRQTPIHNVSSIAKKVLNDPCPDEKTKDMAPGGAMATKQRQGIAEILLTLKP